MCLPSWKMGVHHHNKIITKCADRFRPAPAASASVQQDEMDRLPSFCQNPIIAPWDVSRDACQKWTTQLPLTGRTLTGAGKQSHFGYFWNVWLTVFDSLKLRWQLRPVSQSWNHIFLFREIRNVPGCDSHAVAPFIINHPDSCPCSFINHLLWRRSVQSPAHLRAADCCLNSFCMISLFSAASVSGAAVWLAFDWHIVAKKRKNLHLWHASLVTGKVELESLWHWMSRQMKNFFSRPSHCQHFRTFSLSCWL